VLICLGVETHYREFTRRLADDAVTYATVDAPIEHGPIWEQVQPEWRAV
jgi:hypothetical protein